ncbi:MAG TPA: dTDP-glucose 4,6-dehydratase [Actinomycetota bacterium]|nr:dTDP-glucose 4,6-dehydratase [Actinomycetota bacterium]
MTEARERVLVTGGAGFIGSHLVDLLLERGSTDVVVLDRLTYAGSRANIAHHEGDPRLRFVLGDVADPDVVAPLVAEATRVVHAAAESFVDRSISSSRDFVISNVLGTQVMLEACRELDRPMLLVSTDEVYGSAEEEAFTEDSPMRPRNPYSASKAGADLLARSYVTTYGMAVKTIRGTNAYGPRQHPEKAIPTWATAAMAGRPIPVYGDGEHRREWLYVRDFVTAIATVMDHGEPGGVYNIGGGTEMTNLEAVDRVVAYLGADPSLVTSVPDRPGHDRRYGMTWARLEALGWRPATPFPEGLAITLAWYRDHLDWVDEVLQRAHAS